MKRKTKILIFIIVIIVILLPIYLLSAVNKKIDERDRNSNSTAKNKTVNEVQNKINNNTTSQANNVIENNTIVEKNEVVNNTENNTTTNTATNTVTNNTSEETSVTNPEEKAIQIAKKDWGEDSLVYFSYDGIDGATGNYIVGVRDRENTYIKCWYYVDVKSGEFTVKR